MLPNFRIDLADFCLRLSIGFVVVVIMASAVLATSMAACGMNEESRDATEEAGDRNPRVGGDGGDVGERKDRFVSVSAGVSHSCGVKTDGSVKCWGSNFQGQSTPPDGSFSSVSAGWYHTCGVRTDGSVADDGENHTCGVRTDNSVQCWGLNDDGVGRAVGQATPPTGEFVSVSAGNIHTCGVKTDGSIECWGIEKWLKLARSPHLLQGSPPSVPDTITHAVLRGPAPSNAGA